MLIWFSLLLLSTHSVSSLINHENKLFYKQEDAKNLFNQFIQKYKRNYDSENEMNMRFKIFKHNLEIINRKNSDPDETAQFGINQFTDLTAPEFINRHTGVRGGHVACPRTKTTPNVSMDHFDWRSRGVVTRVKHQGVCGSCWAFSAIGSIEGAYAIKHRLMEFSEQQMVSCDRANLGCTGGWPVDALRYAKKGLVPEASYPYTSQDGNITSCKYDRRKVVARVLKIIPGDVKDEERLLKQLKTTGPIAIAIDTTELQSYVQGILQNCPCSTLNHGVLLVGYGTEDDVPYWTVKNSWGPKYGEAGYFRIRRGVGSCGMMNTNAVFPVVA